LNGYLKAKGSQKSIGYGDNEKSILACLGGNAEDENHEMIFQLQSKSKKVSKNETAIKILGQNQGLDKKHPTDLSNQEWQIIKDEFTRQKNRPPKKHSRSERW